MKQNYVEEVMLLLNILPIVMEDRRLALKGGTAINLFYQNLPRLSVDIDLVYLPIEDRNTTFQNLFTILGKIKENLETKFKLQVRFTSSPNPKKETKLLVSNGNVEVKIEPNFIIRGTILNTEDRNISEKAQKQFNHDLQIQCVSFADVYGGKICAAMDRQHPRDLFDLKIFLENHSVDEDIKNAFIFYLLSNNRPLHEILDPQEKNLEEIFNQEFIGMIVQKVSLEELLDAQQKIVDQLRQHFSEKDKLFLISFANNQTDWSLYSHPKIADYPSIQWKLLNQNRMDLKKRKEQLERLKQVLKSQQS